MSSNAFDITIIGGGVAGMYAGICAGLRNHKTLIIECSNDLGGKLNKYPAKEILDLPGYQSILAADFVRNLKEQLSRYRDSVTILLNSEISKLEKSDDLFWISLGDRLVCSKTLILANGMGKYSPRKLSVDNADVKNVKYNFNNPFLFKDKRVAILGGGDSAVDYALMLQNVASEVFLIHRRNEFRAHEQSMMRLNKGVKILTPYLLFEIVAKNKMAHSLILKNKDDESTLTLQIDEVVVAYGIEQANDLFQSLVVCDSNGIAVNINQETSYDGIFAIGDSCFYKAKYKNITSALGEAANVVNYISNKLQPEKVGIYFSSTHK